MIDRQFQQQLDDARDGHRTSLRTVLVWSRHDLRRFAEYYRPLDDVDDAMQDGLLLASRRLAGLCLVEAYAWWPLRIVKSECSRVKRARWLLMPLCTLDEIEGPHCLARSYILGDITPASQSMPVHYRKVMLRWVIEVLTIAKLASHLSLLPDVVKVRLHRALGLLHQLRSIHSSHDVTMALPA